jgi:enoyl-CoA hydratase/carnithine racemase
MPADAALSIGLVDHLFAPEEIDDQIRRLIAEGNLVPKKGRKDEELPSEFQQLRRLFQEEHIQGWLDGKFVESDNPMAAKTAKIIAGKAPLALKLANRIIDAGYDQPLKEGLKEELAHLNEIFSTADALTGLTSVGKGRPVFEGK